jgi:3-methylcrotonyl-CoA carboxylase alpha subunit
MLESLLIANRGEIARRIIRTARRLGVRTIAVYSAADAAAPFVREADEAVAIGPAPAALSYLNGGKILDAARSAHAAAIHPGYGFLSENAEFAAQVEAAGLVWVGAPPAAIAAMGMKDAAKTLMLRAGVPVTPGYLGADQAPARLQAEADAIGYPVLIKAVAGGGGRGMRRVDAPADFATALAACRREAAGAFGDDRVLLERYVASPRHLEVQVFGDTHGRVVHLFERDCTLQRRHQKVLEEAPAPGMSPAIRERLCGLAVRAARAVNYVGAGTIEFIADASAGLDPDRIWFMEMNTRLQVEHPVTEAVTGEDLVEWQLRVACGEPLPRRQEELQLAGCAMEARLYAENPSTGFLPSSGVLAHLRLPAGVRIDSAVEQGDEVTGYYDALLAKLIVLAPDRPTAARRLAAACADIEVWPVHTNAAFLARLAADPAFLAAAIDTAFIARHAAELIPGTAPDAAVLQAAAVALTNRGAADPWEALPGFRVAAPPERRVVLAIDGGVHTAVLPEAGETAAADEDVRIRRIGADTVVFQRAAAWRVDVPRLATDAAASGAGDGCVYSPMPGRIVGIGAAAGQGVVKGQMLVALEAMKMEQSLLAPFDGVVAEFAVKIGDQVGEGVMLVRIAAPT